MAMMPTYRAFALRGCQQRGVYGIIICCVMVVKILAERPHRQELGGGIHHDHTRLRPAAVLSPYCTACMVSSCPGWFNLHLAPGSTWAAGLRTPCPSCPPEWCLQRAIAFQAVE